MLRNDQWKLPFHCGSSAAQSSSAYGQRVRKRQPLGGFTGLGTSPSRTILLDFLLTSGSAIGIAEIRLLVYGCTLWNVSS